MPVTQAQPDQRSLASLVPAPDAPHLSPLPGGFDLPGIEIFAVGEWNGEFYSKEDLAGVAESFSELLMELHPWVTINHADPDSLSVALGHVARVYTNESPAQDSHGLAIAPGERLYADLVNLPRDLAMAIVHRNFQRPSVELRIDYTSVVTEKQYPLVLQAVSFEGAELEAVRVLGDLLKLYSANGEIRMNLGDDAVRVVTISPTEGGRVMRPKQATAPKQDVTKFQAQTDPSAGADSAEDLKTDGKMLSILEEILALLKKPQPEAMADTATADPAPQGTPEDKKEDTEEGMSESGKTAGDKNPKASAFEDRLAAVESENRLLKAELTKQAAAKLIEKREASARTFVEKNSSEKVFRIPTTQKERVVYLLANAPSQTRKFAEADGKEEDYADVLKVFVEALPDQSSKFSQTTTLKGESTTPQGGVTEETVRLMAEAKLAKGEAKSYLAAFDEVFNKLSPEEQLQIAHPEWVAK